MDLASLLPKNVIKPRSGAGGVLSANQMESTPRVFRSASGRKRALA